MRLPIIMITMLLAAPALGQDQQCWDARGGEVCISVPDNVRVIDGDTFELDGEVIRLWGIEAPEIDQPCNAPGQFGAIIDGDVSVMASFMLAATLVDGVSCEQVGSSLANTVVRCANSVGNDVAGVAVLSGLAYDHPEHSGGRYAELRRRAQEDQVGVWAPGSTCIPPWEWRAQ